MSRAALSLRLLALAAALGALTACTEPAADRAMLGTLERDRIEVVASASEPIAELFVHEGDRVKRLQPLGRLDDRRGVARLAGAEARVRRAEARLAELERGARSEQRAQVVARLAADRAELAQARLDHERAARLVASEVLPQEEADLTATRLDAARAKLAEDEAALDEMVSGATAEELRQARADLEAAEADAASLRVDLERMSPVAPVDARVDAVPYRVGELPGAGATLFVLLSSARPHARVHVPEDELARAAVGTAATVEADGLDAPLSGCLRFVSREAAFTPHFALSEHDRHRLSFVAEVELTGESADDLPTGLPVRVQLDPGAGDCSALLERRRDGR